MPEFVITAEANPGLLKDTATKGDVVEYSFDFSPWVEDHEDIDSVTWEVTAGTATISGEALASNVATALVTFPNDGKSLIKLTAVADSETKVVTMEILSRDTVNGLGDYV